MRKPSTSWWRSPAKAPNSLLHYKHITSYLAEACSLASAAQFRGEEWAREATCSLFDGAGRETLLCSEPLKSRARNRRVAAAPSSRKELSPWPPEMRLEAETELKERLRIAGCFCKQGGRKSDDDRRGSNFGSVLFELST